MTFNVDDILAKNVLASEYLKALQEKSFDELVDEIYERAKDTDPWLVCPRLTRYNRNAMQYDTLSLSNDHIRPAFLDAFRRRSSQLCFGCR